MRDFLHKEPDHWTSMSGNASDNASELSSLVQLVDSVGGGTIRLPAGTISMAQVSISGVSNIKIIGCGAGATKLLATEGGPLFNISESSNVSFESVEFDGGSVASSAVVYEDSSGLRLRDVAVSNTTSDPMLVNVLASGSVSLNTVAEDAGEWATYLDDGAFIVIQLEAGTYQFTSATRFRTPYGERIQLRGADPVSTTISSLQSVSGSAGAYSVAINVASTTGMSAGEFVVVRPTGGTGPWQMHGGCWEIASIDSGTRLTVTNTAQRSAFPSTTMTGGTVTCIKTRLDYYGCSGIRVEASSLGLLDQVVITGDGVSNANGLEASGIDGTDTAIYDHITGGGSIVCGLTVGINGFAEQGLVADNSSFIYARFVASCNNGKRGIYAANASAVHARNAIANGNGEDGLIADYGGSVWGALGWYCGNGGSGIFAFNGGRAICNQAKCNGNVDYGAEARFGYVIIDSAGTTGEAQYNQAGGVKSDNASQLSCQNCECSNNTGTGVEAARNGAIRAGGVTADNNTLHGIRAQVGGVVQATDSASASGNTVSDFRYDNEGSIETDSGLLGGRWGTSVRLYNTTFANRFDMSVSSAGDVVFGTDGTNRWVLKNAGVIHPSADGTQDIGRSTEYLLNLFTNYVAFDGFTVAELPAASSHARKAVYCSDGDAGSPCLAVSNGTNWLRISLGAAVSAT